MKKGNVISIKGTQSDSNSGDENVQNELFSLQPYLHSPLVHFRKNGFTKVESGLDSPSDEARKENKRIKSEKLQKEMVKGYLSLLSDQLQNEIRV